MIPGLLLGAEPELGVDECRVPLCEQKIKTCLNDQSGAHLVQWNETPHSSSSIFSASLCWNALHFRHVKAVLQFLSVLNVAQSCETALEASRYATQTLVWSDDHVSTVHLNAADSFSSTAVEHYWGLGFGALRGCFLYVSVEEYSSSLASLLFMFHHNHVWMHKRVISVPMFTQ